MTQIAASIFHFRQELFLLHTEENEYDSDLHGEVHPAYSGCLREREEAELHEQEAQQHGQRNKSQQPEDGTAKCQADSIGGGTHAKCNEYQLPKLDLDLSAVTK